ncbi:MAG: hypothetical protein O3A46_09045, partial [Candidatus Poribacteria bacterium]|nr:hypothetical protein [Candidatus Poribacteria bacterium]
MNAERQTIEIRPRSIPSSGEFPDRVALIEYDVQLPPNSGLRLEITDSGDTFWDSSVEWLTVIVAVSSCVPPPRELRPDPHDFQSNKSIYAELTIRPFRDDGSSLGSRTHSETYRTIKYDKNWRTFADLAVLEPITAEFGEPITFLTLHDVIGA